MKKTAVIIFFGILFFTKTYSQIPEKPNPPRLVNDYVNLLDNSEKQKLENKLVQFSKSSSTQIAIVIVEDLGGYAPGQFAYEIGEKWGVGQEGFDNGIVILVKPTGGQGERHAFIAPGYGLEAVIPDAIAKRIVDHELISNFKNGNFYKGFDEATNVLMSLALQEFSAQEYKEKTNEEGSYGPLMVLVVFFILFLVFKLFSVRSYARSNSIPFWTALWLANSVRGSHYGSYGNFNSGGGSFGGFGGFGGGSFGGGGAGGSW